MCSCQCCITPHPLRLLERYHSSIETIRLIEKNCSIFENILLDEYEQLERIIVKFNKYFRRYTSIFSSYLSPLIGQFHHRLENRSQLLYELECLMRKCSIWRKNYSTKEIHSRLKSSRKQFQCFEKFVNQQQHSRRKFDEDLKIFQRNYQQQSQQMDSIEYEHLNLVFDSIRLFSSIISSENLLPKIDIEKKIKEWKEKNRFHIPWLSNEHLQKPPSDIDIKPIDDYFSEDTYAYESNLSWSFTIPEIKEDLAIPSSPSQSSDTSQATPANRVRLAIEAIERNTTNFSRGRKS